MLIALQRQAAKSKPVNTPVPAAAKSQRGHAMPALIFDLMFVAIGAAALAVTAMYLSACEDM